MNEFSARFRDAVTPMVAAVDMSPPFEEERPWVSLLAVESEDHLGTSDSRIFPPETFSWMPPPLTAHVMTELDHGHMGAEVAARIVELKRVTPDEARMLWPDEDIAESAVSVVVARGWFAGTDRGREAAVLVDSGTLRRVSVQPRDIAFEANCTEIGSDDFGDWCMSEEVRFVRYQIAGLTILDTPGMENGLIRIATQEDFDTFETLTDLGEGAGAAPIFDASAPFNHAMLDGAQLASLSTLRHVNGMAMVASMGSVELRPPAAAFQKPALAVFTRLTVSEPDANGWLRIFGHVAPNQATSAAECHLDYPGECRLAPSSPTGYAHARSSVGFPCDDGTMVYPMSITMGGEHTRPYTAGRVTPLEDAFARHSDADQAVAYVNCGDDEFGWWVAGVIRPDVTPERLLQFRASKPSGEWWPIDGAAEGIAVHMVNAAGFRGGTVPMAAALRRSLDAEGAERWTVMAGSGIGARECRHAAERALSARVAALETEQEDRHLAAVAAGLHGPESVQLERAARRLRR